jgi:hypothetical protein
MAFLRFLFAIAFISEILVSCNRDSDDSPAPAASQPVPPTVQTYDTADIGSYWPLKRGSWWNYRDSNNLLITHQVDSAYVLGTEVHSWDTNENVHLWCPKYDTKPVSRYTVFRSNYYSPTTTWFQIMLVELPAGSTFNAWRNYASYGTIGTILQENITMTVNSMSFDSVMVVGFADVNSPSGIYQEKKYFAKDIGIILDEYFNYAGVLVDFERIEAWYIAP